MLPSALTPALEALLLVTALSVDAFVASFAYGANKIRIPLSSVAVINLIDLHHFGREEISPLLVRAKPMVNAGLMRLEGERLFLTPRGFLLSNSIIAQLLEEE